MLFIILLFFPVSAYALSIFPNMVEIETRKGEEVTITFEVYNNTKPQEITLSYVNDLTDSREDEQIIEMFMLARDDRRKFPLTFIMERSKIFYICFAQDTRTLYARSCSKILVEVQ